MAADRKTRKTAKKTQKGSMHMPPPGAEKSALEMNPGEGSFSGMNKIAGDGQSTFTPGTDAEHV